MRTLRRLRHPAVALCLSVALTAAAAAATRDARALGRAVRAREAGRSRVAVAVLEARAPKDATALLVLGTAYLEVGRPDRAVQVLAESVARARAPETRRRALHNLSTAHLRVAAGDARVREVHARAAAAAATDALRLRASVPETGWNLALAHRLLNQHGGGGSQARDGGIPLAVGTTGAAGGQGGARSPMSAEEAGRILDALRSEEGPAVARGTAQLLGSRAQSQSQRGPPW